MQPLRGDRAALTEAHWAVLEAKLAAFRSWNSRNAGGAVEKLGLARVRRLLVSTAQSSLSALIAKDKAKEAHARAVVGLKRLR